MKPFFTLWLALLSPLAAIPATTTLTLVNDPNFNRITVMVDPGFGLADTEITTLTGTVQAAFDINPANGQTSELTLTNGRANGTNMTFSKSVFIVGGYTINVTNLSAAINTIAPPGLVTAATGQFAANQHRFDIDQGNINGSTSGGLIGNNTIAESFSPTNPATGTGSGTGSVFLIPTTVSGIYQNFSVTATLPVSITDSFATGGITVALTATGTVRATGTVQVPKTEYLAWTLAQGVPNAPFGGDPNGDGVSNGLLWALGLNFTDNPGPYLPRPDPSVPGGFLSPLPTSGTAAPILIQSSNNLGTWAPAAGLSPAANPIPAQSTSPVTIAPDGSPRRFVRLLVNEPS